MRNVGIWLLVKLVLNSRFSGIIVHFNKCSVVIHSIV